MLYLYESVFALFGDMALLHWGHHLEEGGCFKRSKFFALGHGPTAGGMQKW